MSLRDYLQLLHRGRWWISTGLVLGALIGLVVTLTSTPMYTATGTVFLAAIEGGGEPGQAYQGSLLAEQKAPAYADLISSDKMHDDVAGLLLEDVPYGSITALAGAGSPVLTIQAQAPNPDAAQRFAQIAVDEAGRLVAELERPLDPLLSTVLTLRVVTPPGLPTAPSSPNGPSNIALGAVLGAVAGLGVTLVRRNLDRSIRSAGQLETTLGRRALAVVPRTRRRTSRPMMSSDPDGDFAHAFRRLRSNLSFRSGDDYGTVLVTEPVTGHGAGGVACNLATALGLEGRRVLLVDADLRGHAASSYLGISTGVGLADMLAGERMAEHVTERWANGMFDVLPSGGRPRHPSELVGSDRMRKLLTELAHRYDTVIVSAPAVLDVVDPALLSPLTRTTVLVVRHARTTQPEIEEAVAVLEEAGATLAGGVLVDAPVARGAARRRRRAPRRGLFNGADVPALPQGRTIDSAAQPPVPPMAPGLTSDVAVDPAPEAVPEPAPSDSVVDSAELYAPERPVEDERAALDEHEPEPGGEQDPDSDDEPGPATNKTDGAIPSQLQDDAVALGHEAANVPSPMPRAPKTPYPATR